MEILEVYIGSVLLEKNRHSTMIPSLKVSDWATRFKLDGFDGIELWENHLLLNDAAEKDRLASSDMRVKIYNTYAGFENEKENERIVAAQMIRSLGAEGVKFNFGNDPSLLSQYVKNLKQWSEMLPKECRILCECHPNTVMEYTDTVQQVMKSLNDERLQLIVHALGNPVALKEKFGRFGSRITHAHFSTRKIEMHSSQANQCFSVMDTAGFKGTLTLEFTRDTADNHENADILYQDALSDFDSLKEAWL